MRTLRELFLAVSLVFIGTGTEAQCWEMVQTGANHCIGIKSDGTLWAWGANNKGQLGNGGVNDLWSPTQVGWNTDWSTVATGRSNSHNLAIKTDGTLWAWGFNFDGQVGAFPGTDQHLPVQVGTDSDWSQVACGMFHSMAIKTDGTLWGWGTNASGQMANTSTFQDVLVPTMLSSATDWAQISCGDSHNLALTTSGDLYAWGFNLFGSVGNGNNTMQTYLNHIGQGQTWTSIAAGDSHSLAVRNDNTLWSWGANGDGQLGLGNMSYFNVPVQVGSDTDWAKTFCGEFFSFGIKTDGSLWAWGENAYGQLGVGNSTEQLLPMQVGTASNWVTAQGGRQHATGLNEEGQAFAWGRGTFGTLGNGTGGENHSNVPVQVLCWPLGLNDLTSGNGLNIYPNPASDAISFALPEQEAGIHVTLYDAIGRKCHTSWVESNTLDIGFLPAGLYIVEVNTGNESFKHSFLRE